MAIDLEDLDSAIVRDGVTGKQMFGVAMLAGEVTLTTGDISVSDVTIAGGTVNVEPGVLPLHDIVDSGSINVEPGTEALHAVVDSGIITIPSRSADIPLGLVKVQSGDINVEPGSLPIHSVVDSGHSIVDSGSINVQPGTLPIHGIIDSGHIIVDSVTAQVKVLLDSQISNAGDAVLTTSYADNYIAKGMGFQVQRRFAAISAGSTYKIVLDLSAVTPGKIIFILPLNMSADGGPIYIKTYKITNYTGGTAIVPQNLNAISANIAQGIFKNGIASADVAGADLREYEIGSLGNPNQSRGGSASGASPYIVPTGIKICLELLNNYSSAINFTLGLIWYEI